MFPTWRMRLREARVAYRDGRYDDASEVLSDEKLRQFLPAKKLAQEVAGKILKRAGDRFAIGDSAAGWRDVHPADRLGGQPDAITLLRQTYQDHSLHDIRHCLASGQPTTAITRLEKL